MLLPDTGRDRYYQLTNHGHIESDLHQNWIHYIHWQHSVALLPSLEARLIELCQNCDSSTISLLLENFGGSLSERRVVQQMFEQFVNHAPVEQVEEMRRQISREGRFADPSDDAGRNGLEISLWSVRRKTGKEFKINYIDVDESHPAYRLDQQSDLLGSNLPAIVSQKASQSSFESFLTCFDQLVRLNGESFRLRDVEVRNQIKEFCSNEPRIPKIVLSGSLHIAQSRGISAIGKDRELLMFPIHLKSNISRDALNCHAPRVFDQKSLKVANGLTLQRSDLLELAIEQSLSYAVDSLKAPFGNRYPAELAPFMETYILNRAIAIKTMKIPYADKVSLLSFSNQQEDAGVLSKMKEAIFKTKGADIPLYEEFMRIGTTILLRGFYSERKQIDVSSVFLQFFEDTVKRN